MRTDLAASSVLLPSPTRGSEYKDRAPCLGHAAGRCRFEPRLCGDSQRGRLMIGGAGACNRFVFNIKIAKDASVFR